MMVWLANCRAGCDPAKAVAIRRMDFSTKGDPASFRGSACPAEVASASPNHLKVKRKWRHATILQQPPRRKDDRFTPCAAGRRSPCEAWRAWAARPRGNRGRAGLRRSNRPDEQPRDRKCVV